MFSKNENVFEEFKNRTSSGSFGYNECLLQIGFEWYFKSNVNFYQSFFLMLCFNLNQSVPFGGVGASGVGAYHGKIEPLIILNYSAFCIKYFRKIFF